MNDDLSTAFEELLAKRESRLGNRESTLTIAILPGSRRQELKHLLPILKVTTQAELDAISIPDKVETSIGLLEFFDGVPSDATIESLYDNLDRTRGLGVYLDNMGNWLQTVPGKSWFPVSTNRRRRQV